MRVAKRAFLSCMYIYFVQTLHAALHGAHGRVIESITDSEASVRMGIEASEAIGWQSILSQRMTDRELSMRSRTEMDSALGVLRAEHDLRIKQMESSNNEVLHGLQTQISTLTSELGSVQRVAEKAEADLKAANEQLSKAQSTAKAHTKTNEALTKAKDDITQLQHTTEVYFSHIHSHANFLFLSL